MAAGSTHFAIFKRASLVVLPVMLVAPLFVNIPPIFTLFFVAGWLTGGVVTPDTDIQDIDYLERRLLNFSTLMGALWIALWYPLASLQKHRGVSHWPIVGTLTRMGYLAIIIWGASTVITFDPLLFPLVLTSNSLIVLSYLAGQELAVEVTHLLPDVILTRYKRWRR